MIIALGFISCAIVFFMIGCAFTINSVNYEFKEEQKIKNADYKPLIRPYKCDSCGDMVEDDESSHFCSNQVIGKLEGIKAC